MDELMPTLAITFLREQAPEQEDPTPEPENSNLSDILQLLEIEDQDKEQVAIDAAVNSALSCITNLTWLPDIDEMNEEDRERRTEELLKASDDE